MIKVIWFLKRAPHLTLAGFGHWWRSGHAPDILCDQSPYLRRHRRTVVCDLGRSSSLTAFLAGAVPSEESRQA